MPIFRDLLAGTRRHPVHPHLLCTGLSPTFRRARARRAYRSARIPSRIALAEMGNVLRLYGYHATWDSHCKSVLHPDRIHKQSSKPFLQGIAVRTTVNFDSRSTLLVVGTFDAISAGILLYGGIAQILVGDWLANSGGGGMRKASLKRVAVGGASLTAGLIAMSVIGLYT